MELCKEVNGKLVRLTEKEKLALQVYEGKADGLVAHLQLVEMAVKEAKEQAINEFKKEHGIK